jgi:hypothetical protein
MLFSTALTIFHAPDNNKVEKNSQFTFQEQNGAQHEFKQRPQNRLLPV